MHPYLVHSSGERPAEHHTCSTIETQTLKLCFTFLAVRRYFTNSNLVTDNLNWLSALCEPSENCAKIDACIVYGLIFGMYFTRELINFCIVPCQIEMNSLWELSFDSANILFEHLSVPDLLLHVPCFSWVPSKHQQPRC